jgi:hypothetical protein
MSWGAFFRADLKRPQYLHDQFIVHFSLTSRLWVPVTAGIGYCIICALVLPPFLRAISGTRYPLSPRSWREVSRLLLFYLVLYLLVWVAPLAAPGVEALALLVYIVPLVIVIALVFADYAIVFEDIGPIRGVRRSLRLVSRGLGPVILILVGFQLMLMVIEWLYELYYRDGGEVFFLLPVSQILVETVVTLFANILLVFLYEDLGRATPRPAEL